MGVMREDLELLRHAVQARLDRLQHAESHRRGRSHEAARIIEGLHAQVTGLLSLPHVVRYTREQS